MCGIVGLLAITDRERIPRWFLPITGELELGGRYQLEGNAEGSILECTPPESLKLTWEFAGNVSWVHIDVTHEDVALTVLEGALPDPDGQLELARQNARWCDQIRHRSDNWEGPIIRM